jgi:universal stress protein A
MKTILTPVDFSAATQGVLEAAVELARDAGGRLVLFNAVQLPLISTDYGLTVDMMQETLAANREAAARQLAHLEKRIAARGVVVTTAQADGFPPGSIVDQARKVRADYIVMGSHGHTAFYELIVGSTTHAVLKNAPCPVLIVPPPGKPRKKAAR